jgi:hypothetical protein|tara:strand:+ start:764 stop:892 length:129 start_codon:yes stop_codon:yes gene_type:complete
VEKASHAKGKLFENLRKQPDPGGTPVYLLLKKGFSFAENSVE